MTFLGAFNGPSCRRPGSSTGERTYAYHGTRVNGHTDGTIKTIRARGAKLRDGYPP